MVRSSINGSGRTFNQIQHIRSNREEAKQLTRFYHISSIWLEKKNNYYYYGDLLFTITKLFGAALVNSS